MRMTFFIVDKLYHEREDTSLQIRQVGLRYLDLSLVALYEGKTRREMIVKMVLEQPDILLYDERLRVFPPLLTIAALTVDCTM